MSQTSENERAEQIWSGWSKFGVGGEKIGVRWSKIWIRLSKFGVGGANLEWVEKKLE